MPRSTINGTAIDLDGKEMILDADADTSITVDTDDQIDIKIAGSDSLRIKANEIENVSGDITLDSAGDIILSAAGGEVRFDDGSQQEFVVDMNDASTETVLRTLVSDSDLVFEGNDGGVGFEAMRIDMSEGGKVGIGTGSVAAKLHVQNGDGSITPSVHADELLIENSANSGITIGSGTSNFGGLRFADSGGDSRGNITYSHADDRFQISTADSQVARILSNGALQVKQASSHYSDWAGNDTGSQVNGQATDKVVFTVDATTTSYASDVQRILCDRSATSSYDFLVCTSGNLGDDEFRFSGEGNGSCDGSFGGGGADYAEYFEWKDGNASKEDRVGISVKLDGNMIVASSDSDNASDIIGVISANPAVTGDGAWNKWNQKYLRDDFGRYIKEEYTVTEWQENVEGEIDNNINSVSYETDKIPSDVTVPKNAKVLTVDDNGAKFTRRKLNPNYDESKTYVPREDRPEWDTVGLMGKLRIKKGQKTGANWIKMRDISDTVEEWLVR